MRAYEDRLKRLLEKPWLPYVFPFALFLLLTESVRFLPALSPFLYIAKTIIVGALLWFWRHEYAADISHRLSFREWPTALFCGLLALIIWIVPVMEELFWRSFLMRYLINQDFRSVPMGAFTWFSFMGVAILFGLEHHRVIVGIIAGLLYNLLLIRQKKLKGAILAHGVTNLGLGIYVLLTGSWMFW